ncbi:MAG: hypothetical protein WC285_03560 [Candidatus Gracilibacteria bacterium]|jgi:hypothetical protein
MKFLKNILVTLVTALITMMAVYSGYTIYAEGKYNFEDPINADTMRLYHEGMNDLFNTKLEKVVEILDEPEGPGKGIDNDLLRSPCTAEDFKKVGGTLECEQKCLDNPDNVSTYCVSVEATDRHIRYITHLTKLQTSVNFDSIWAAELRVIPLTDVVYNGILARNSAIDEDISRSREVLEATLAAYNEFITAYPIHIQYKTIIRNLITYKNKLKDVRSEVVLFPSSFIDTTSTKCE